MPNVRGVRPYSFYNDEDIDDDMSVEDLQTLRLSRVPAFIPVKTLAPIIEALRRLVKDVSHDADVREFVEEPREFVAEDDLLPSDMSVTVDGVGLLQLPLDEDMVVKLMAASVPVSSISAGLQGTNNSRHYQMVPASHVSVEFKEEAVTRILKIISESMNINVNCSLKLDVVCLSICGPGQVFGSQGDSGRGEVKPVRLEIVLPSHCVGGGLYIKHGTQTHKCSTSEDSNSVRWIAYYSDCARQLLEVEQGHRVALIYDVSIEYLNVPEPEPVHVDISLNDAVTQHFSCEDRLLVFLLHKYPENCLHWHKLKGRDLTYTRALQSVAKSQDLRVFLGSARCLETWETSGYHGPVRNGGSVELDCWVDESGRREFDVKLSINYEGMAREVCTFRDDLWALGEPDREVKLGWYGEGPAIREQWYHRACVVLIKK